MQDDNINFDNMESPITASQFLEMQSDIKEIRLALKGSSYGDPGLVGKQEHNANRIDNLYESHKMLKGEFNQFKTKIIAYTAGAAGTATAIIQIVLSYWP